jgi:hypothetical protein
MNSDSTGTITDMDGGQFKRLYDRLVASGYSFAVASVDRHSTSHGAAIEPLDDTEPDESRQAPSASLEDRPPANDGVGFDPDTGLPLHSGDDVEAPANPLGADPQPGTLIYPSLRAFVERFVTNVFAYQQAPSSHQVKWMSDWWRYPCLVFPLDAMWRGYEAAAHSDGREMQAWYFQALQLFNLVFGKDRGIVASLPENEDTHSAKGEPLPVEEPYARWHQDILETLMKPPAWESEPAPGMREDDIGAIDDTTADTKENIHQE